MGFMTFVLLIGIAYALMMILGQVSVVFVWIGIIFILYLIYKGITMR